MSGARSVKIRKPVAKKRKIAPKGKTPAVFVLTPRMLRLEEATFEPPKVGRGGKPFVPKGTILVPGVGLVEKDVALTAAARAYRRKHKAAGLRTRPVRVKLADGTSVGTFSFGHQVSRTPPAKRSRASDKATMARKAEMTKRKRKTAEQKRLSRKTLPFTRMTAAEVTMLKRLGAALRKAGLSDVRIGTF